MNNVKCCWENGQKWLLKFHWEGAAGLLLLWIPREQCLCYLFPWLPKPLRKMCLDRESLGIIFFSPQWLYVLAYCKNNPRLPVFQSLSRGSLDKFGYSTMPLVPVAPGVCDQTTWTVEGLKSFYNVTKCCGIVCISTCRVSWNLLTIGILLQHSAGGLLRIFRGPGDQINLHLDFLTILCY